MRSYIAVNWKSIARLSGILASFALLFSAMDIFYSGEPVFETIWHHIVTFHVIGFTIIIILEASSVFTLCPSPKKGGLLLILFVLGGFGGLLNCYVVYRYVFRVQVPAEWFGESVGPVLFFSVFFSVVITSYEALREKVAKTAAKLAEKELHEKNLLRLKTKAELEALRAKVNPHFLFNTLNSIASLIPLDPHKAEEMIVKLSNLFRYTLDASSHDMVRLTDELHIIAEYLEIEKVRLGARLSYAIELGEGLSEMRIPGLLLQPLVENSVKHGIAAKWAGGNISLRCRCDGSRCSIEIDDTGEGFTSRPNDNGFGLQAVRERLDLQYRQEYDFRITDENGVHIRLSLPVSESGESEK